MNNPELELINKFEYDRLDMCGIEVYFCKDKSNITVSLDNVESILNKIPEKHRKIIPRIYFVNYSCTNHEVKGRHLAGLNYIIVYPNAADKLTQVLFHETGHVIWDRLLTPEQRIKFYYCMLAEVPITAEKNNALERHIFILENFANSYWFMLDKIFDTKQYPKINEFILSIF